MQATYSPEDNKLRLYSSTRLDSETYARVRAAGFIWAPKQELFVAPMWTPDREDILIELAGEIGDEDTSLVDRAEARAERFEDYSERRAEDANRAHEAVKAIADNIPFGQPILVGHHSERHARKHAEQIESGMRKAVKMWDTSKYWEDRAAGAISHAKYKELPAVRARRIKKIEADLRKRERSKAECERCLRFWNGELKVVNRGTGAESFFEISEENKAKICDFIGRDADLHHLGCTPSPHGHLYSAWDVLQPDEERYKSCPAWTVAQCQERARDVYPKHIAYYERWIAHYKNRLTYERAMLAESGGLVAQKQPIGVGGQVRRRGQWFVVTKVNMRSGVLSSVTVLGHFAATISADEIQEYKAPAEGDFEKVKAVTTKAPLCNYPGKGVIVSRMRYGNVSTAQDCKPITQAQWDALSNDYKSTRDVAATAEAGRHRVRYGMFGTGHEYLPVFITDAKLKNPPAPEGKTEKPQLPTLHAPEVSRHVYKAPERTEFDGMRETLRAGVQVVSAPQLFPTPPDLARTMVEHAAIESGHRVLEPSAGTGNIAAVIREEIAHFTATSQTAPELICVEINLELAHRLARFGYDVRRCDFLERNGDLGTFDRILMNPPFENGSDIKHILHALHMLKPGGRLVAICANGPRQQEKLRPMATEWVDLPAGTFKSEGTSVNTALVVFTN